MSDERAFSLKTRAVVDPDSLLTEDDKAPKEAKAADCTTRRRACKNCVCGRAEVEAKLIAEGKLADDVDAAQGPPPGGCGNCSRGDAFRCAQCPYNGTPAWNAGEDGKVQLNLTDDV
uniref:Anamorsin C-terminal domain-containing protein n=1 Tax=Neobodo designis TaxID=312471 RepID=A0A7S1QYK6_NEODS